jgi:hypothetical protein
MIQTTGIQTTGIQTTGTETVRAHRVRPRVPDTIAVFAAARAAARARPRGAGGRRAATREAGQQR